MNAHTPDRLFTIAASFVILMAIATGALSIADREWLALTWQAIAAVGFGVAMIQQRRAASLHAFLEVIR